MSLVVWVGLIATRRQWILSMSFPAVRIRSLAVLEEVRKALESCRDDRGETENTPHHQVLFRCSRNDGGNTPL